MNGSIPPALLILPLLAPVGFGSDTLPFPLVPTGERDSYGAIELQPAPLEILALRAGEDTTCPQRHRESSSLRPRLAEQLEILFCEGKIGMREYGRRLAAL